MTVPGNITNATTAPATLARTRLRSVAGFCRLDILRGMAVERTSTLRSKCIRMCFDSSRSTSPLAVVSGFNVLTSTACGTGAVISVRNCCVRSVVNASPRV